MKAVILAAGEGNRMRPLTQARPKVMLPVANKPIIEHLIDTLISAGIRDFIIVTGYQAEQVEWHFGDGSQWGADIQYCRQDEPLGTADAIFRVKSMVEEHFLVLNGDTLYRPQDISGLLAISTPAMGVIQVADARNMGVVTTRDNWVSSIVEKVVPPPTNIANAGIYLFNREIFSAITSLEKSPRGEYEIPGAIQALIDSGTSFGWYELSDWLTFSNPWDLLNGGDWVYEPSAMEILGTIEQGAVIKDNVGVGKGTVIRSGSYICGPVIIGNNCDIGPNCFVRASTSIGDSCHIGASVEIKNSIIMAGTRVPHLTYIGDSVIGEGCNFGSGTQIANLRFDNMNVKAAGIDSGRRKLGAVIGDRVSTGINVSIDAGTVIGSDARIGPGVFVRGAIEPGSRIFRNQQ